MTRLLVVLLLSGLLLPAWAAEPVAFPSDSLTEIQLDQRLSYLQRVLSVNERHHRTWWVTWTALYGTATVGQAVVAAVSTDRRTVQDMVLGAGTTALGVVGQCLTPMECGVRPPSDSLPATYVEKARQLALCEEQLGRQARIAAAGKNWQPHVMSGAVNLASGLVTWLGFKRTLGEGLVNFALNTVVTEVQILTQPARAKRDLERYRQGGWSECSTARSSVEWYGSLSATGALVGLRF